MKHSQGEWKIGTAHDGMPTIDVMVPDGSGDSYPIAELVGHNADNNARFLLCAPEMLAELRLALAKLAEFRPKSSRGYQDGCFQYVVGGFDMWSCDCPMCRIRRVVAKATGEAVPA